MGPPRGELCWGVMFLFLSNSFCPIATSPDSSEFILVLVLYL